MQWLSQAQAAESTVMFKQAKAKRSIIYNPQSVHFKMVNFMYVNFTSSFKKSEEAFLCKLAFQSL